MFTRVSVETKKSICTMKEVCMQIGCAKIRASKKYLQKQLAVTMFDAMSLVA